MNNNNLYINKIKHVTVVKNLRNLASQMSKNNILPISKTYFVNINCYWEIIY